ncbi:hypothetical protein H1R20_g1205, partial [Candolleomyces eurysporus]
MTDDEMAAAAVWEDLDVVAREVLGTVVSAQVHRSLLSDMARRGVSFSARDMYACLFDRYGHGDWDSGNWTWERARAMTCSGFRDVVGYVEGYIQAMREVDESLLTVSRALMVEVMLSALPSSEFSCLLDDFRRERRLLGAAVADMEFADVLRWSDEVLALHRQLSVASLRSGSSRQSRRPLPVPPGQSHIRQPPPVAAAALLEPPVRPSAGGGVVSSVTRRDPQSSVPGGRFSSAVCENCRIPGHSKAQCLKPGGDRYRGGPSIERSYLADADGNGAQGTRERVDHGQEMAGEMDALVAGAQAIDLDSDFRTNGSSIVAAGDDEYNFLCCAYDLGSSALVASSSLSPASALSSGRGRAPFNAVIDSGCTKHVLNDLQNFHDYVPQRLTVGTANSKPLVVHGRGTVKFAVRMTDGSALDVVLVDCLYAPSCPVNLISVGALTDVLKWRLTFTEGRTICWQHVPGQRPTSFLVLPRSGRLSVMACDFVPAAVSPSRPLAFVLDHGGLTGSSHLESLTFVPPRLTSVLWHRRFGHPGHDVTKKVIRGGVAEGVVSEDVGVEFKCVACIKGKVPQAPFLNNGYRFQLPGELVHMDVCGPFPVMTRGYRYFIVMVDDATNFAWTSLMRTRDEAYGIFKFVEARLETMFGRRIIRVRLDGAAELCKGVLEGHFKERGIWYQVTARYAHPQNGKAERYVRTLQDKANTMLGESLLPQSFFGDAVLTAQYLLNRLPTTTLPPGVTPYEALFGKKPDLSRLRVFGCRCYPLIPPELRRKGDGRRYEAIFLGYQSDRIGWTVMGVDGKIVFAHDVVFDESTMGVLLSRRSRLGSTPAALLDATPGPRRSSRLAAARGGSEDALIIGDDVGVDFGLVALFDGAVGMDSGDDVADGMDVARCWTALHVAEDVLRRKVVRDVLPGDGGASWRNGAPDSLVKNAGSDGSGDGLGVPGDVRCMVTGEKKAIVSDEEDEYDVEHRKRVELLEGYCKEFKAYMCVVGHRRIFDDPGEVPASVAFDGGFRDLDGVCFEDEDDPLLAMASYDVSKPPATFAEAMRRPDREVWIGAMRRELAKLKERGTFEAVERPVGRSLVGVKWVYDYKYNPDGTIIVGMEKARLVAQGFSQRPEEYGQTHAPVVTKEGLNTTYTITAAYDHELYVFDIKQAFTHSRVREEIYCRQIPGFPEGDPKLVLRLRVALYGLKQAAFEWYCLFLKVLLSIGMRRSELDHAFFIGVWRESPDPDLVPMPADGSPLRLLVPIHVDDGLASTNSCHLYRWFIRRLKENGIEVVDLGVASMYLAARIHRDRANRRLWISQSPFITNLLEDWKMFPCNAVKVPLETMPADMPESKQGVLTEHMPFQDFKKAYQSIVGSIQYLASSYRPDLSVAAMVLGHHNADPEPKHMAAAKHVLRYLYGTRNHVLMFDPRKTIDDSVDSHIRAAAAFMDADWASDSTTRLSMSGYAIYFMGCLVGWSSKRQRVIALSSTEAEYYAIVHATKQVLWFRLLLMICGIPVPSPFPMLIDNKSAIAQASSPAISARSKHVHIKYLYAKNHFIDGTLSPHWVPSSSNVADLFTKLLSFPLFDKQRTALGVIPSP